MMLRQFAKRSFSSAGHVPIRQTQLFINNKFVDSADGKTFDTFNPATEKKLASVQEAGEEDVNRAVAAARKAFDDGPWRRMSGAERGRLMYKLADLIEANIDELAVLEVMDNGKPLAEAKHGDLNVVLKVLRHYAGWADKIHGQTIPLSTEHFCYSRMEPVGVCAQIIPWNFPLAMMAWKLGPALSTGCTVVMKPAEQTPLTALRVAELAAEAGYPEGVLNLLPGFGATAGASLMKHKDVDKVAFTGSTSVGYDIMRNSHVDNLKRVTLELGGKSANIIMDDADMDLAVNQTEVGLFMNQGQCCIAGTRVFVHEKVHDEFLEKAAQRAASRRVGDPLSYKTQQGAQIDQKQFDKILSYVDQGKAEGAKLVTGGARAGDTGYFVEPTVFADVEDNMKIAREEIFGPVMSVLKFRDVDEVIRRANDSQYGLGGGLVTQSMDNILKITHGMRTGTVYVNCYNVLDANTPFGGFKDSGIGRELGEPGLKNYLEHKTVIIKRPEGCLP